jgi:hypothetical protein
MIDDAAKACLPRAQLILGPLALGDVAHQAQKPTSALLELANANLHREGVAVLAPVASLESDRFPGDHALLQALDGRLVETDVEIAFMSTDKFLPAVAQTNAGLAVDVENSPIIVEQKEGVSRVIHEGAESRLARAQLGRERGHDQRRCQEGRDPLNILRNINAELEQWRREEVVQAGCRDDR